MHNNPIHQEDAIETAVKMEPKNKNFERCHPSVRKTKKLELPKKRSPWSRSPFFHLFFHDKTGFQKEPQLSKMEAEKKSSIVSDAALKNAANAINIKIKASFIGS